MVCQQLLAGAMLRIQPSRFLFQHVESWWLNAWQNPLCCEDFENEKWSESDPPEERIFFDLTRFCFRMLSEKLKMAFYSKKRSYQHCERLHENWNFSPFPFGQRLTPLVFQLNRQRLFSKSWFVFGFHFFFAALLLCVSFEIVNPIRICHNSQATCSNSLEQ